MQKRANFLVNLKKIKGGKNGRIIGGKFQIGSCHLLVFEKVMRYLKIGFGVVCIAPRGLTGCAREVAGPAVLKAEDYRHHVTYFNRMEDENKVNAIPNAQSWDWMKANIPLFDCPQDNFREIYYYRWWTYRKHIHNTPQGFVITEFLVRQELCR